MKRFGLYRESLSHSIVKSFLFLPVLIWCEIPDPQILTPWLAANGNLRLRTMRFFAVVSFVNDNTVLK